MKIKLFLFIISFLFSSSILAEDIETRISNIEKRLSNIENIIETRQENSLLNLLNGLKEDNKEEIPTISSKEIQFPLLTIEIVSVKYVKDDFGSDIVLNYILKNKYDQMVKSANHKLIIFDRLDNELKKFNLDKDLYLASGNSKKFEESSSVVFVSEARIKDIKIEDLVFRHYISKVLMSDNSIKEYDDNWSQNYSINN